MTVKQARTSKKRIRKAAIRNVHAKPTDGMRRLVMMGKTMPPTLDPVERMP